jgi:hypothetical protein
LEFLDRIFTIENGLLVKDRLRRHELSLFKVVLGGDDLAQERPELRALLWVVGIDAKLPGLAHLAVRLEDCGSDDDLKEGTMFRLLGAHHPILGFLLEVVVAALLGSLRPHLRSIKLA